MDTEEDVRLAEAKKKAQLARDARMQADMIEERSTPQGRIRQLERQLEQIKRVEGMQNKVLDDTTRLEGEYKKLNKGGQGPQGGSGGGGAMEDNKDKGFTLEASKSPNFTEDDRLLNAQRKAQWARDGAKGAPPETVTTPVLPKGSYWGGQPQLGGKGGGSMSGGGGGGESAPEENYTQASPHEEPDAEPDYDSDDTSSLDGYLRLGDMKDGRGFSADTQEQEAKVAEMYNEAGGKDGYDVMPGEEEVPNSAGDNAYDGGLQGAEEEEEKLPTPQSAVTERADAINQASEAAAMADPGMTEAQKLDALVHQSVVDWAKDREGGYEGLFAKSEPKAAAPVEKPKQQAQAQPRPQPVYRREDVAAPLESGDAARRQGEELAKQADSLKAKSKGLEGSFGVSSSDKNPPPPRPGRIAEQAAQDRVVGSQASRERVMDAAEETQRRASAPAEENPQYPGKPKYWAPSMADQANEFGAKVWKEIVDSRPVSVERRNMEDRDSSIRLEEAKRNRQAKVSAERARTEGPPDGRTILKNVGKGLLPKGMGGGSEEGGSGGGGGSDDEPPPAGYEESRKGNLPSLTDNSPRMNSYDPEAEAQAAAREAERRHRELQPLRAVGLFNDVVGIGGSFTGARPRGSGPSPVMRPERDIKATPAVPVSRTRPNPVPAEIKQGLEFSRTPQAKKQAEQDTFKSAEREAMRQTTKTALKESQEAKSPLVDWREVNDQVKGQRREKAVNLIKKVHEQTPTLEQVRAHTRAADDAAEARALRTAISKDQAKPARDRRASTVAAPEITQPRHAREAVRMANYKEMHKQNSKQDMNEGYDIGHRAVKELEGAGSRVTPRKIEEGVKKIREQNKINSEKGRALDNNIEGRLRPPVKDMVVNAISGIADVPFEGIRAGASLAKKAVKAVRSKIPTAVRKRREAEGK